MRKIVVDTNIIYYLTGLSVEQKFDIAKYNQVTRDNNCELAISIFSLVEILQWQYGNSVAQQKVQKLLTYLRDNHYTVIADKNIELDYYHVFDKCLKSKKEIDYYYDNITPQLRFYGTRFLRDLSISVGFIFSRILYGYDKDRKNPTDEKSTDIFSQQIIKAIHIFSSSYETVYQRLLADVYDKKSFNREPLNDSISKLMDETLRIFYSLYQALIRGAKDDTELIKIFNEPTTVKINVKNYRNLLRSSVNNQNIEKYLNILYEQYFDKHDQMVVDTTFKNLLMLVLTNQKTEFNDIIDYLNLLMPANAPDNEKIIYFTLEKDWIEIIEQNLDDPYFADCYNFYKLVTK